MALRLVFMGTPEFAVPTFKRIAESGHKIVAVYTRAPRPGGRRGLELTPTPVEQAAKPLGIPIFTPKSLKGDEAVAEMRAHGANAAVVVAYGLILPKTILDAFPLGCFNLHASLLPRWRGAAPIHRAVMAGDRETGVMVMKMDEGLDTGPVAKGRRIAIGPDSTAGELHDLLADRGADLMFRAVSSLGKNGRGNSNRNPNGAAPLTPLRSTKMRRVLTGTSPAKRSTTTVVGSHLTQELGSKFLVWVVLKSYVPR